MLNKIVVCYVKDMYGTYRDDCWETLSHCRHSCFQEWLRCGWAFSSAAHIFSKCVVFYEIVTLSLLSIFICRRCKHLQKLQSQMHYRNRFALIIRAFCYRFAVQKNVTSKIFWTINKICNLWHASFYFLCCQPFFEKIYKLRYELRVKQGYSTQN
jgi:hypothetical protein